MNNLKIASTHYPENTLEFNKWMKKYKVASRINDTYKATPLVEYIASQYNQEVLHKMIRSKPSIKISDIIKKIFNS
jgi:hypothetical protein